MIMIHIKEILIDKYGKVPVSLYEVFKNFEDGKEMFFSGLASSFTNRKKTPFERYIDIARIVFGFFEQMYVYQTNLTLKDKFNVLLGKKFNDKFWKSFLNEFLSNESVSYEPCKGKARKDNFFEEYEKIFSICPEIRHFSCISHHFMRKIQKKTHPFMTGYLIGFLGREEKLKIRKLLLPFLLTESVIHGIDDYVDDSERSKSDYTNDIFNIIFGLFALTLYLLEQLKVEKTEIPRVVIGKKSRIEELVDSLFFSMVGLSEVPIIEKDTIKIIDYREREEMEIAVKNMKIRAAGINIFLVLSTYLLGKKNERDYNELCNLIKYYRMVELLEKDLKDIRKDLKNKDYTPVAVWWKKYKGDKNFKERVRSLAEMFQRDANEISGRIRKYPNVKTCFMDAIDEKFKKIISDSERIKF